MLQAMVDDIPPVRTPSGRRRTRPDKLDAATVDDRAASRGDLRRRGIAARIARRGIRSSTGWGGIAGGWSGPVKRCRVWCS
jgi:hypothetical protein